MTSILFRNVHLPIKLPENAYCRLSAPSGLYERLLIAKRQRASKSKQNVSLLLEKNLKEVLPVFDLANIRCPKVK